MEIIFFILWVLFIFFAGKGKGIGTVVDIFRVLKHEFEKSAQRKHEGRTARGSPYTPRNSASSRTSQREKKSPWGNRVDRNNTREDHIESILETQREHHLTDWKEGEEHIDSITETYEEPASAPINPEREHGADVNTYVGDIIEERRRNRLRPTRSQGLMRQTKIRDAFLLKELLDKPVSMRD